VPGLYSVQNVPIWFGTNNDTQMSLLTTGELLLGAGPSAAMHAATKQYVDGADSTKVAKAGDTMTGNLKLERAGLGVRPPGSPTALAITYLSDINETGVAFRPGPATDPGTANTFPLFFYSYNNAAVGYIATNNTTTSYGTSSDGRLKEDLKSFDAGNIVDKTNVYDFAWKTTGERSYGVLAQQAQEIYPAAVLYKAEEDWWGIDYSKYVPVLLQEMKALRARVAQLEAGPVTPRRHS
jgi:hypothetical protein